MPTCPIHPVAGFRDFGVRRVHRPRHRHGAINLGQGYPDFDGPEFVKEAGIAAIRAGKNQYSPMIGLPELRQAVAEHQRRFYGLAYDPDREVTVYAGATEGIFSTLQALCDAGDEVVLFEPYYDSYPAGLAMAGHLARRPRGDDFRLSAGPRGGDHPEDAGRDAQLAPEPRGQFTPASRGAAEACRRRSPGDHRRGLRAPALEGRTCPCLRCPACASAR
jgi:hypothetical protein